jgi:hypothetical protein
LERQKAAWRKFVKNFSWKILDTKGGLWGQEKKGKLTN